MLTIIVRPQPGADATAARLREHGVDSLVAPLFSVEPLEWALPRQDAFDRILFTSANALRHGGPQLSTLSGLPAWCVGAATADAATAAGFVVERTGAEDAASLLNSAPNSACRWIWLAGARHQPLFVQPPSTLSILPVYVSVPAAVSAALQSALQSSAVLLAHSAAAAERLKTLVPDHASHHLVALSAAVAMAAGNGWQSVSVAASPADSEMVAKAAMLCQNAPYE
jgi:uroporphyrinogen-III synthase